MVTSASRHRRDEDDIDQGGCEFDGVCSHDALAQATHLHFVDFVAERFTGNAFPTISRIPGAERG